MVNAVILVALVVCLVGFAYGVFHHARFLKAGGQHGFRVMPVDTMSQSTRASYRAMLIGYAVSIGGLASGMAVGFVPWHDITGAGIARFRKQQFLGIAVRNSEQYLARVGRLKRMLMKTNRSTLGYVINIPQVALPVSIEKLLAHINEYRRHVEPRRNA